MIMGVYFLREDIKVDLKSENPNIDQVKDAIIIEPRKFGEFDVDERGD